MVSVLKKYFLTFWIALSLLAVPLPSFAGMQGMSAGEHCAMQADSGQEMRMSIQQSGKQQACPDCAQDASQQCSGGCCSTGNCVSAHTQTVVFSNFSLAFASPARNLPLVAVQAVISRAEPPLLRPPV